MTDDSAICLERDEVYKRKDERKSKPTEIESYSQSVVRKEEAHEKKRADRCRERHEEVDREHKFRVKESVDAELRHKLLDDIHFHTQIQVRYKKSSMADIEDYIRLRDTKIRLILASRGSL